MTIIATVRIADSGLTGRKNRMNVLEKILEEIKQPTNYTVMCGKHFTTIDRVEEIIRSHMDDCKTFEFDFNRVKSFDCQCGRHYVNTYNNGWIPVEERLPEEENERYYPMLNVATSYGAVKWGFYRVRDKQWYIYSEIHDEFIEARDKEIVAWQPLPERYKGE